MRTTPTQRRDVTCPPDELHPAHRRLPLVWRPLVELAHRCGRQIRQQLREVNLRVEAVPAAGACEAGKNRGGFSGAVCMSVALDSGRMPPNGRAPRESATPFTSTNAAPARGDSNFRRQPQNDEIACDLSRQNTATANPLPRCSSTILAHFARPDFSATDSMCSITDRLQRSTSEKTDAVHVTLTKFRPLDGYEPSALA